jgi:O-antigen/teichoic acid export membrane protein
LSTEAASVAGTPQTWRPAAGVMSVVFKGAWAVGDQALFAVSNFAVNIIMARWLPQREYGAFTLAFSIYLILGPIHSALLVEPMIVFGAGKYRETLRRYLRTLMQAHWWLTAGASLVLAAVGVGFNLSGQHTVGMSVLALAVANPFLLLLLLVRRSCCIRAELHLAASGGLFYLVTLIGGAYLLLRIGWLSAPTALALMGICSLIAAIWIHSRLTFGAAERSNVVRRDVLAQHWEYGRWLLAAALLGSVVMQVYFLVMPALRGLEGTATLKALINLAMPATQTFTALSVVTVPSLVRMRNTAKFGQLVRRALVLYLGAAVAYWLLLGLVHQPLIRLVYGGQYAADSHLLWILGLLPIASGALSVFESALRAQERSDQLFRAYLLAFAVTVVVGLPLTYFSGPAGAILGLVASTAAAAASMAWSLRTASGHQAA